MSADQEIRGRGHFQRRPPHQELQKMEAARTSILFSAANTDFGFPLEPIMKNCGPKL